MVLAEIVFASRLLGLVAGEQVIDVQLDAAVRSIEVQSDGVRIATLNKPPWRAVLDFGTELAPHELTVVAFDQEGRELGRDTQAVNVARPPAELGILLNRDQSGRVYANIRWSHYTHQDPASVTVKLDGRLISKGKAQSTVSLGAVDSAQVHVLGVEASFADGVDSRKEIVFGGVYSEQMPAELTPIAVRQRHDGGGKQISCFSVSEQRLPGVTHEKGDATAFFIMNGSALKSRRLGLPSHSGDGLFAIHKTELRILNPVAQVIDRPDGVTIIFDSRTMSESTSGTRHVLKAARTPDGKAQIADAVGAAALQAQRGARRRVVVLILGDAPAVDRSAHRPAIIRRYLRRVGIPLRVWSLTGPRPDLADSWGEVRDVSTAADLLAATEDLRKELDSQRVAWVPVAPLNAFRVKSTADCGYVPLAGNWEALKPSGRGASAR